MAEGESYVQDTLHGHVHHQIMTRLPVASEDGADTEQQLLSPNRVSTIGSLDLEVGRQCICVTLQQQPCG